MTAEDLIEGTHRITGVTVTEEGDGGVVVRCPCGWSSHPHALTRTAAIEWQHHRDRATTYALGRV